MNPDWFGDSYDIVKRFFINLLKENGYKVFVNPMFTGNYQGIEDSFYYLIGASKFDRNNISSKKIALFLDPDTGIGKRKTSKHVIMVDIIEELKQYDLVFSFDQSFSRNKIANVQMNEKLKPLSDKGLFGFYYNSHARFLFAGKYRNDMEVVISAILNSGLPKKRLISNF